MKTTQASMQKKSEGKIKTIFQKFIKKQNIY